MGEQPRGERWKLLVLLALVAAAAVLVHRAWEPSLVHWHLGTLLQDPGDAGARQALLQLGERLYPYLEEDLASADPDRRFGGLLAIGVLDLRGPQVDRMLEAAVLDPDPLNALNAAGTVLDRGRAAEAVRAFARLLDRPERAVRFAARRQLARASGVPWWALGQRAGGREEHGAPARAEPEAEQPPEGGGAAVSDRPLSPDGGAGEAGPPAEDTDAGPGNTGR
ncbi:MAG: hypothetical protein KatS3mg102_0602 [Planctomycetota bacterium]|nr:MAG: hypothetical protein KatS3mg102_0602 [Planctomycetota bacterium]